LGALELLLQKSTNEMKLPEKLLLQRLDGSATLLLQRALLQAIMLYAPTPRNSKS
jgi:hypothetical protein